MEGNTGLTLLNSSKFLHQDQLKMLMRSQKPN